MIHRKHHGQVFNQNAVNTHAEPWCPFLWCPYVALNCTAGLWGWATSARTPQVSLSAKGRRLEVHHAESDTFKNHVQMNINPMVIGYYLDGYPEFRLAYKTFVMTSFIYVIMHVVSIDKQRHFWQNRNIILQRSSNIPLKSVTGIFPTAWTCPTWCSTPQKNSFLAR